MALFEDDPSNTALQNELVLQEIFKFLPLHSLLSSSLVNKFWNAQIRTYIRDHRKCTAYIASKTLLPCDQLEKLDQDLAKMTIIPFNSLNINLRYHTEPKRGDSGKGHPSSSHQHSCLYENDNSRNSYEHLFANLKLKHLRISWDEDVKACPVTLLLFRLLTEEETARKLKGLSFDGLSTPCVNLFSDRDKLELPVLEDLEMTAYLEHWLHDEDRKRFLQKILNGAPKLKKIIHDGDNRILEILPEEKYSLLNRFEFHSSDGQEHIHFTRKLIERAPRISELYALCFHKPGVPPPCQTLLFHSLVQSCFSFLKILEITGACLVQQLRLLSPLANVTSMTVYLDWDRNQPFEFFREFQLVPLQHVFPKLDNVSLGLGNSLVIETLSQAEIDREFSNFTAADSPYSSQTVRSLDVHMEVCSTALLQLMKRFPNLIHLQIKPGSQTSHLVPYKDIFRFWSNLKTLTIDGHVPKQHVLPNCDSGFCGIFQEEVELLWNVEDEHLKNLHIVPVRPCVSTMKNLESLSIQFFLVGHPYSGSARSSSDPRCMFLSPVTKSGVFKRMPWLDLSLKLRHSPSPGVYVDI